MVKQLLVIAVLLAIVFCNVELNKVFNHIIDGKEPLTELIAQDIYKHYKSTISNAKSHFRYKVFLKNLQKIVKHNSEKHSWKMGINDFTDMTKEEI